MPKFAKKPVVIEATQWFSLGDHPAVTDLPDWHPLQTDSLNPGELGFVATLEGGHVVTPGDWIITGVRGEHYACKPDIFAETYEPA